MDTDPIFDGFGTDREYPGFTGWYLGNNVSSNDTANVTSGRPPPR